MSVLRGEDGVPRCSIRIPGVNGKMVDAFIGDVVRASSVDSLVCNERAYIDGLTKSRVKVFCKGRIGYYLPKNLVFVARGRPDGSYPVEPYRRVTDLPGVISVQEDDDSVEVISDTAPAVTADFVKYLEEVTEKSCNMAKATVEFAITMEMGRTRFSKGWAPAEELDKVKEAATAEMERRLEGFEKFVKDELIATYTKKGKK